MRAIGQVEEVSINLYTTHILIGFDLSPLSVYMCLLYAPGPIAPLYDLCLEPACIPVGHVLHTDQQEEGDVEHADVRSPPHTEQEGHVELCTEF